MEGTEVSETMTYIKQNKDINFHILAVHLGFFWATFLLLFYIFSLSGPAGDRGEGKACVFP